MKEQYVLAYDYGGTQARAAIVGDDGILIKNQEKCADRCEIPTGCTNEKLDQITLDLANRVLSKSGLRASELFSIGFASAGTWKDLIIEYAPNISVRNNITAPKFIKERLGVETFGANDLRAAVYCTAFLGSGQGLERVATVTYSTGNNAAIFYRGSHYPQDKDLSQEVGHAKFVDPFFFEQARVCGCGAKGCYEAYVSGTSAALMAREALMDVRNPNEPILLEALKDAPNPMCYEEAVLSIGAKHVYRAFRNRGRQGIDLASSIQEVQKHAIASQIASIMLHHRPEVIELMGSMTKDWDVLFEPAIEILHDSKMYNQKLLQPCPVKRNPFGDDIGLLGAGVYGRIMRAREMEFSH
jgi:glucokinase